MRDLEDTGISIASYLKIFFRRKELIIIPSFLGLILGICTGLLLPKEYKSSSVILVQEGKTDNPLFNKLAVSTTVRQRMVGIKESILGWNSMLELIRRLDLAKEIKNAMEFEKLVASLRRNIIISLRGSNIIYLAYVGTEPETTKAVVQNVTDIFIEKNVDAQNQETADAIIFIEEQLKVYKGKIKSAEIAKLQDKLDEMMADSTEKHPVVKQIKEQIEVKRKELQEENLEFTESINFTTQATNPIVDEIKAALNNLDPGSAGILNEGDIYKAMLIADLDSAIARDVKVNENIYNTLLQRLETAKITQRLQSSKEGTKYTILDPPRIPLKPVKPNKPLVGFIGLFLGVVLGAGLIISAEFLDKSFIDVEEAKDYLGVPLLGAISKINTEDSLRRVREQLSWIYSLVFVAGAALIVVTITISNFLK